MSIPKDVRAFFLKPENLSAEATLKQLAAAIETDNLRALGVALNALSGPNKKELLREKNADGVWAYRYNPKFAAGGKPARAAKKPRKVKPVKPRKPAAAKKARRKYTRRASAPAPLCGPAARWAVTSDGAFVDLASPATEIHAASARALVDFVRKLDASAVCA